LPKDLKISCGVCEFYVQAKGQQKSVKARRQSLVSPHLSAEKHDKTRLRVVFNFDFPIFVKGTNALKFIVFGKKSKPNPNHPDDVFPWR